MNIIDAIRERHSVRQYTARRLDADVVSRLEAEIGRVNAESGLGISLVTDEPRAFGGLLMRTLVKFSNADNYFAIAGRRSDDLEELSGYYGERLVLYAQTLGLNTCWAMFAGKKESRRRLEDGYEPVINIAVGYGENQGVPHENKPVEEVADLEGAPEWFARGVECAMLAPTGMNKQGFRFERDGGRVRIVTGTGKLALIDRGIVKYHFECGAGRENFEWAD